MLLCGMNVKADADLDVWSIVRMEAPYVSSRLVSGIPHLEEDKVPLFNLSILH